MNTTESIILLNMIPEIGPIRFRNLKNRFGDTREVFSSSVTEIQSVEGISQNLAHAILASKDRTDLVEKELKLAETNGIAILVYEHPHYPPLLKTMSDPPPVLYCKGDLKSFEEPSISVVGTRHPTPYGERVATSLSRDLAELKIVTVSGLARGIDTIVHHSTLAAGGKTIAVLGSGLLKIYPPENKKLANSISDHGILLSEFPLTAPPDPGQFPRRNRIIAGLSFGTVVVEANEKSGALITAQLAAEQGKDIFAVPGPVTSKMSRGPHQLIRNGAKLVERCQDILEEITPLKERFSLKFPKIAILKNSESALNLSLNSQEEHLLGLIQMDPVHIDYLGTESRLASGQLFQTLLNLEMKGAVKSLPGKMYVRN